MGVAFNYPDTLAELFEWHSVNAEHGAEGYPSMPIDPLNEPPQYLALRHSVDKSWDLSRRAFRDLRRQWFNAIGLTDPERRASNTPSSSAPRADRDKDVVDTPSVPLTPQETRALDDAIEQFLTLFAGEERTAAAYVEAAGILQESVWLAHEVGLNRGHRLAPGGPNPALTASQRRRVMEQSFERLSEEGRLRFEDRLIEIRDEMIAAFNDGENPLRVADRLGAQLSGYERGRLKAVVLTEMGTASERAIEGTYAAAGVEEYDLIGDPTTDSTCVEAQNGGPYPIGGDGPRAPLHPFCFCSMTPARQQGRQASA